MKEDWDGQKQRLCETDFGNMSTVNAHKITHSE